MNRPDDREDKPGGAGRETAKSEGEPPRGITVTRLSCQESKEHLHRHVEGELDPLRASLVERHLETCEECRGARARLEEERLWLLEVAIDSPPLSERFRDKVLSRIREEQILARRARRRGAFLQIAGVAIAAAVVAAVVWEFQGPPAAEPARNIVNNVNHSERFVPPDDSFEGEGAALAYEGPPLEPPCPPIDDEPRPPRAHSYPVTFVDSRPGLHSRNIHLAEVVSEMAIHLDRSARAANVERPQTVEERCRRDLNRDGKVDANDIVYSCQVLMDGLPPESLTAPDGSAQDPECASLCL